MNSVYWQKCFAVLLLGFLMTGCVTAHYEHNCPASELRANHIITVADDFIVDVYLNGMRIPDDRREQLAEIFGATVERVNVQVHRGDWLVFHVVNDRLRWNGCYYFAAAGVLQTNEFGFVSETASGNWSACDDPAKVRQFIEEKRYLFRHKAQPVSQAWQDGTPAMKKFAGDSWPGTPLWGLNRDTWLKVILK